MSCSAPGAAASLDPSSSSKYPMVTVEEALARVMREVQAEIDRSGSSSGSGGSGGNANGRVKRLSLQNCRGFVTAEDIYSMGV